LLAISLGGVQEALMSNETYNIVWGNHKGFAQAAIDAKVAFYLETAASDFDISGFLCRHYCYIKNQCVPFLIAQLANMDC
jgi:hypothetical protein